MKPPTGSRADPRTPLHRPSVRAIFLVGFMGAGKTSVGRVLGRRLGWGFEDLDDRIQNREHRGVEQIFRESGEAAFRRAETAALRQVLDELGALPRIVALGGGAFAQPENATLLQRSDVVSVLLDGPVEELFRRCNNNQQVDRPLRGTLDQFQKLYELRRPMYNTAGIQIDTAGKDVEAVADEVSRILEIPQKDSRSGRET